MTVDYYVRSPLCMTETAVQAVIAKDPDIARQGYVVDRLRPVMAERHGEKFWKYVVPVMQVAR